MFKLTAKQLIAVLLFTNPNPGCSLPQNDNNKKSRNLQSETLSSMKNIMNIPHQDLKIMDPIPRTYNSLGASTYTVGSIPKETGIESDTHPLLRLRTVRSNDSDVSNGDGSFLIFEETEDGYTVLPIGGEYVYADVDDKTGNLSDTGLVVGIDDPLTSTIQIGPKRGQLIEKKVSEKSKMIKESITINNPKHKRNLRHDAEQHERRQMQTSGTLKNLVVAFKFSDHADRSVPRTNQLRTLMNHEGPHPVCPTGSVRDVYLQSSFGQLDLQSVVAPWVTLDPIYTEAYCANGRSGLNIRIHECIKNALSKLDASGAIDFDEFDTDNDALLDSITFFHSGYAAEWGGYDAYGASYLHRVWSHKWSLWGYWRSASGVYVYDYIINPSLWGTSGEDIGRIGVISHEIGHFLGLPDLYDGSGGSGIGSFGLMANSWGFDWSQYYPPLMSAWSKVTLGWVDPTVVSTSGTYYLKRACHNADIIKITSNFPSGEYILIENRQPCGFEAAMPEGGLAIWHIDEHSDYVSEGYPGQSGWPGNNKHYRVALLQADGNYELEKGLNRGNAADLFRAGHVDSIDSDGSSGPGKTSSWPNTKSYQNGNIIDTEISISNIGPSSSTMEFHLSIGGETVTDSPSASPTQAPSASPTKAPSASPTQAPSASPTKVPTIPTTPCTLQSALVWFDAQGLNRFGDAKGSRYPNGTPLFDPTTGMFTPHYEYVVQKFPQKPWCS